MSYLNYQLGDGWQLTIVGIDGTADAWLMRSPKPGELYGRRFADGLPFDLAALDAVPCLRFDYRDRPYIIWPCGSSALVWRCDQDADLWVTPAMSWTDARAP